MRKLIREFSADDVSINNTALVDILEDFKRDTKNEAFNIPAAVSRYSKLVAAKLAKVIVSELDRKLCGIITFIVSYQVHTKEKCAVESFWHVLPGFADVERDLITAFEITAKTVGCKKVTLHTSSVYHKDFGVGYERNGYSPAETNYSKEI